MRLTIDHPITLTDDGLPDGLGQVTFSGTGWTKKKCIFAASDERGRRQVKDHAPIHFLVEVEIEVVEGHLRIAPCFSEKGATKPGVTVAGFASESGVTSYEV